ncbi:hypothetical protein ADL27_61135, partial [Streptomyces sp. NRRL F-6602]
MVNRRSFPAVSLAVAAALALSACGGGDGKSGEDDKIAGADGGGGTSAAPEPGASPEVKRPAIKLPTDMKNVFEGGGTGDPV